MPSPYDPRHAVKVGGSLYIKSKNTRLMADTAPTADVLAIIQPPTLVTWLGAVPIDRRWHRIRHGGRVGYVFHSNLASSRPNMQVSVQDCGPCGGTGAVMSTTAPPNVCAFEPCRACGGDGRVDQRRVDPKGFVPAGTAWKG